MQHLILVRSEPPGQFTAQAVGIPEARVTAATKEQAIQQVRGLLAEWLSGGQLVPVEVPEENPLLKWAGHAKDDPDFDLYLEEIRRYRQEVDERFRQEANEHECSDSSSTPTT
jgi:hypothetical protein